MNELTLRLASGAEEEATRSETRGEVVARQDAVLRLSGEQEEAPNRYRFDGLLLFPR